MTSWKKRRISNSSERTIPSVVKIAISEATKSRIHHPPLDRGAGAEVALALAAQREAPRGEREQRARAPLPIQA